MTDYLVDHAVQNAWCSPRQDLQVILQPARITPPGGVMRSVDHSWSTIPLPTTQERYHVYQIGQVNPATLGLTPGRMTWRSLARTMETENLIADVYTEAGLHLNRSQCFVVYTEERNLLLAVQEQPVIARLSQEPLFLRLYSNAFFDSVRSRGAEQGVVCRSMQVTDAQSVLRFQNEYIAQARKPGLTLLYHNGYVRDEIRPSQAKSGDILEYVYDSSVKQVVELPVRDLKVFESQLDNKRKYLLHYPQAQALGETIDYRDDIDVYLVRPEARGNAMGFRGIYFHKNHNDALRQLTHRDYSIPVMYVNAYAQQNPEWERAEDLVVRLHIRQSGWHRPLIHEHHRIKELYKLPESALVQAMHGIESGVDVWKASNLEQSDYVRIMDSLYENLDRQLIESAYGYNAMTLLTAASPLKVENINGRRQVSLPHGLWQDSTMYEYDAQGRLLGHYIHTSGAEYVPHNASCALVEGLVGRGSYRVSTVFGERSVPIDERYNYRCYVCPRTAGRPDHSKWEDVTGDDTQYMVVDGRIEFLVNPLLYFTAVRTDREFLAYQLTLSPDNGLLRFSIDGEGDYPEGAAQGVFHIPVGRLDLWLNGYALIENLDYVVRGAQIVITNKRYLVPGNTQVVTVRGTGFCQPDMTRLPPTEFGYVKYGMLSRNRRYDLRDDRVIRLVVQGRTMARDALEFSEDHAGIQVSEVPNGAPYLIDNVVVPLRGVTAMDEDAYRERSAQVDQAISDYLSLKLPEPAIEDPVMIPERYAVYSPFLSTIMYDLMNGRLSMAEFQGQYSDRKLREYAKRYEYLLDFDPCFLGLDHRYVIVHPHNLLTETELDIYQWRFLSRAASIYLDDRVDLTGFIRVKPTLI